MDKYKIRGVSSKKEDVHNAINDKIDKGLFPGAFCKIVPDYFGNKKSYCNIMHADGAGTKSSLAYVYYRETGDIDIFRGIVMDAITMNIDDLLCIGAVNNFLLSNTIGRNAFFISGDIIKIIIEEFQNITDWFKNFGINITLTGGETADVGDLVRTLIVDSTIAVRMKKKDIITNDNIKPDMVIIGLSSSGEALYEKEYNSGIGSNGLTSARHDLLNNIYKKKYPESFNPDIQNNMIYCGPFRVTDNHPDLPINIGKSILSPTRTYAPVINKILKIHKKRIGGMVHCTGGGQTKCLKFGTNIHYIKDNLFEIPPIFKLIKEISKTSYKEMYQVFNMGHRMEIFIEEKYSKEIIDISRSFNIEAKVVGYTQENDDKKNRLTIKFNNEIIEYN